MRFRVSDRLRHIGVLGTLLLVAGCGNPETDLAAPATAQLGKQWEVVDKYCVECHNGLELAGGFAFDDIADQTVAKNAELWEKATRKLRGRLMPPPSRIFQTGGRTSVPTGAAPLRPRPRARSRRCPTPPPRRSRGGSP